LNASGVTHCAGAGRLTQIALFRMRLELRDCSITPLSRVISARKGGGEPGKAMHWIFLPFRRYADFSGRSRRVEYWRFQLMVLAVTIAWLAFGLSVNDQLSLAIFVLFCLVVFVPPLAVGVRRLHDSGKSGAMLFFGFIPYAGGLILLVLMLLPGSPGENEYGPDPRYPKPAERDVLENVFS
jgi:uncharacterized membrane protein YhaH (DUF805 family)